MHLTDNEGWRIEIKSHPKLTEIGGMRENEGKPVGFFTQEQYKEIVAYAQERFITIVPEIDLPGHTKGPEERRQAQFPIEHERTGHWRARRG